MEAKKSRKAAIESQRGSWLLMGVIVALSFMFVSFEWTQRDVKATTMLSADDEPIFVTELVPITFPEEKLEPPSPVVMKVTDLFTIVDDEVGEVEDDVSILAEDASFKPVEGVQAPPPVVYDDEVEEDIIHVSVENMPEFPGGESALLEYLGNHIKYPVISQETGAEGRVIVQFVVDRDGSIVTPEVMRGVDPYLDREALRVISSMPKWKPGEQNGKKVRVKFTVPVMFKLR